MCVAKNASVEINLTVGYGILGPSISVSSRCGGGGGGGGVSVNFVPIYRFMTPHPIAKLLFCSGEKHQDGRPVPFGFFVIIVYRLTELCILNAENVEKVYGLLFKQTS